MSDHAAPQEPLRRHGGGASGCTVRRARLRCRREKVPRGDRLRDVRRSSRRLEARPQMPLVPPRAQQPRFVHPLRKEALGVHRMRQDLYGAHRHRLRGVQEGFSGLGAVRPAHVLQRPARPRRRGMRHLPPDGLRMAAQSDVHARRLPGAHSAVRQVLDRRDVHRGLDPEEHCRIPRDARAVAQPHMHIRSDRRAQEPRRGRVRGTGSRAGRGSGRPWRAT
jgi:hypothetical protein